MKLQVRLLSLKVRLVSQKMRLNRQRKRHQLMTSKLSQAPMTLASHHITRLGSATQGTMSTTDALEWTRRVRLTLSAPCTKRLTEQSAPWNGHAPGTSSVRLAHGLASTESSAKCYRMKLCIGPADLYSCSTPAASGSLGRQQGFYSMSAFADMNKNACLQQFGAILSWLYLFIEHAITS